MKPLDFRNETFASLKAHVSGQREAVWLAWRRYGPCTTRELAQRSGIDLLNVRPRTNELVELGFVRLAEVQPQKGEGTYRASTEGETFDFFREQQHLAASGQTVLPLG